MAEQLSFLAKPVNFKAGYYSNRYAKRRIMRQSQRFDQGLLLVKV